MSIRSFIAVELETEIKKRMEEFIDKLRPAKAGVKWIEAQNMHITLRFLGDIEENMIPKLSQALEEVLKDRKIFTLKFGGLNAFPNLRRPRVLVVGVREGADGLVRIHDELEEKITELGFEKDDKKFSPHLTLGRVRSSKNKDRLMEIFAELGPIVEEQGLTSKVEKVILMKSQLTPQGPTYTPLSEFKLTSLPD
jgi:2'-5' RNA ligase